MRLTKMGIGRFLVSGFCVLFILGYNITFKDSLNLRVITKSFMPLKLTKQTVIKQTLLQKDESL